jgi:catechol 2,3-dioxygenase-like lactoylglutathione lyase family enzyme
MDYRLELVLVPVIDVDRALAFYSEQVGFVVQVDHRAGENFRVVQLNPPGSACSISIGTGITSAEPGSVAGLHLVVEDLQAAVDELSGRGVPVSQPRHMTAEGWQPGVAPDHQDFNSFADFTDPDGNGWVLQEVGYKPAPTYGMAFG